MSKTKSDGSGSVEPMPEPLDNNAIEGFEQTDNTEDNNEAVARIATVAVVGIGAAVFEAALLPGIVLGVAAMWLPRHFPQMEKR
jgi:hypothetical protein